MQQGLQEDPSSREPLQIAAAKGGVGPEHPFTGFRHPNRQVGADSGRGSIAVELGKLRLFPVPNQTRTGSGAWAIDFEYYKVPTRLTAVANTFLFDDETYYDVFLAGFQARVAQVLGHEDAGQWFGRDDAGKYRGTGLWGKFAGMLNGAIATENRASQEPIVAPLESLELG